MTTTAQSWTSSITEVSGSNVEVVTGGSGNPLVILHDELGHPGWLRYHEALSQNHTLHIPSHPGFGHSDQLDWSMKIHDMAIWYLGALDKLGLEGADLMGFSLGGWLAAELATMCPQQFRRLILVGAGGIRPPGGEIYDIFEVTPPLYIRDSLLDPDGTPEYRTICPAEPEEDILERWEFAMEGTCRVSWRPYMHDPGLVHQVYRLERIPTLLIWGQQDRIVRWRRRGVTARIRAAPGVIDQLCHHPELEATAVSSAGKVPRVTRKHRTATARGQRALRPFFVGGSRAATTFRDRTPKVTSNPYDSIAKNIPMVVAITFVCPEPHEAQIDEYRNLPLLLIVA